MNAGSKNVRGWIPLGLVALGAAGCFGAGEDPSAASRIPLPPAVAAEELPLPVTPAAPSGPKQAARSAAETPEPELPPAERPSARESRSADVASAGPRRVPSGKPGPEVRPTSLLGVGRGALRVRLGTPAVLRREPSAEFWRFSGEGCVLYVFLHESGAGADYRVTHVELLPRGGLDAVPPGCFQRLLLDRRREAG